MSKELTFKLVLNADVKDFIANTKQSKESVEAMFDEIRKQSQSAGQATEQASRGIEQVGDAARESGSEAAKALGVDVAQSLNLVSSEFVKSGQNVDTFANGLKQMGATGEQAATATYQAWQKWLETAKSQAEIDTAQAKLQEFGDKGAISTKQVEMGLAAIKRQAQELPADINPVTAAFERLGIKTKEQLALAAQSALSDFNTIQSSGQATSDQLRQAYERTMQAAAASGDQAVISAANAKAASLGLSVEVDSTGKATVQSYEEMSRAAESHARTVSSDVTSSYRQMGQVAREEAKHSIEAWNNALAARTKATMENSGKKVGERSKSTINEPVPTKWFVAASVILLFMAAFALQKSEKRALENGTANPELIEREAKRNGD